jgi:hypothetical protein
MIFMKAARRFLRETWGGQKSCPPSNFGELVKSRNSIEFVIPANPGSGRGQAPESSYFKMFWTPAFAGVTTQETFYETINFWLTYFFLDLKCLSLQMSKL